jgi:hypothetical protein
LPIVEETGTVTGIVCHIKARSRGGARYDPKQTEEERHAFENLILMCARHSKLIDSEPKRFTVDLLQEMKARREQEGSLELSPSDAMKAEALLTDYHALYITAGGNVMVNSPGSVLATNVTFKTTKSKVKFAPAEGTLGSDAVRRNYVKHLIDRYNNFASKQTRRTKFVFPAIYATIREEFKADWERIPLPRFEDLVDFLQKRVDRTQLGSINRGKGIKNYSTFEEYRRKYAGEESQRET